MLFGTRTVGAALFISLVTPSASFTALAAPQRAAPTVTPTVTRTVTPAVTPTVTPTVTPALSRRLRPNIRSSSVLAWKAM